MMRTVLYLLVAVLVITFLRYVIGAILRALSDLVQGKARAAGASRGTPQTRAAGELKKDPVCGTFVPASTSVKKTVGGEVIHFCSTDCRDKYAG